MLNDFYNGTTYKIERFEIPTLYNVLSISFVNTENITFEFQKDFENNYFTLEMLPTDTEMFSAGKYTYVITLSEDANVQIIETGLVTIKQNPALLTSIDNRSHAKKVLDAIEAVIEGRASRDEMKYNINGRYLEKTPLPDLIALRDRYKREYQTELKAERINKGLGNPNKIYTRFK